MLGDTQSEQSVIIPVADMLYFAKTAAKRDRKGSDWCEKKGVGHDRAALERAWPTNVSPLSKGPMSVAFVRSAVDAKQKLASFCRECGRCRLGRGA